MEFNLYTTGNSNELNAIVTKYAFRDTTIQITIDASSGNSSAFSALNKAMNNQIQLNGDYKQSSLPTGTWAYIYLVNENKQTEVTNTGLRNSLLEFEKLILDKIQ